MPQVSEHEQHTHPEKKTNWCKFIFVMQQFNEHLLNHINSKALNLLRRILVVLTHHHLLVRENLHGEGKVVLKGQHFNNTYIIVRSVFSFWASWGQHFVKRRNIKVVWIHKVLYLISRWVWKLSFLLNLITNEYQCDHSVWPKCGFSNSDSLWPDCKTRLQRGMSREGA